MNQDTWTSLLQLLDRAVISYLSFRAGKLTANAEAVEALKVKMDEANKIKSQIETDKETRDTINVYFNKK